MARLYSAGSLIYSVEPKVRPIGHVLCPVRVSLSGGDP